MNEVKPRPAFSPSNDVVVLEVEAEICLDFYKLRPETRKQTFTQENCKHGGRDVGSGGGEEGAIVQTLYMEQQKVLVQQF